MKKIIIREPGNENEVKFFRETGRGIIIENGRVLMSYEQKPDCWTFPGGGVDEGESYEECCIREICEETGKLVEIITPFAEVTEYYDEARYTSRFYICKITGECEPSPTDGERELDARPVWIEAKELLCILDRKIKNKEPFLRVHIREHRVLTEYLNENN